MDSEQYKNCKKLLINLIIPELKRLRGKQKDAFGDYAYANENRRMYDGFYGKQFSETSKIVARFKEENPQKKISEYGFYDLKTMYAFYVYVKGLNDTIYEQSKKNHYRVTSSIYNSGFEENARSFFDNLHKEGSGYYSGVPVLEEKLVDYNRRLNPIKTATTEISPSEQKILMGIIKDSVKPRQKEVKIETTKEETNLAPKTSQKANNQTVKTQKSDNPWERVRGEEIKYKYDRKTLKFTIIDVDEDNFDIQGNKVRVITAKGESGWFIRTETMDCTLYEGELYDDEYNITLLKDETGEIFDPNKEFVDELKSQGKTFEPKPLSVEFDNEDGQDIE
jgi:hypothetical protein